MKAIVCSRCGKTQITPPYPECTSLERASVKIYTEGGTYYHDLCMGCTEEYIKNFIEDPEIREKNMPYNGSVNLRERKDYERGKHDERPFGDGERRDVGEEA